MKRYLRHYVVNRFDAAVVAGRLALAGAIVWSVTAIGRAETTDAKPPESATVKPDAVAPADSKPSEPAVDAPKVAGQPDVAKAAPAPAIVVAQAPGSNDRARNRGNFGRGSFGGGLGGSDNRRGPGGAGTPVDKNLPAEQQPVAAAGDGKMRFNSRNQPWQSVIAWYAEQAGLSLVGNFPTPEGSFNYQSGKNESLTPAEALDKLNYVLQTLGCTLVRRDNTLMLVDLRNELPPGFIPTVAIDDLDKVGKFEFVNVLFKLKNMTLDEAQAEIENVRGLHSSVYKLPKTNQLSVTDTAERIKTMKRVIDQIENPDANATENLKSIAVRSAKPEDALLLVKQFLNIPADRSNTPDGSLRVVADPSGHRLLVSGKAEAIKRVEEIIAAIDGSGQRGNLPISDPQFQIYPLTGVDAKSVLQVLQSLLAPDASLIRLQLDAQDRLLAYAPPDIQTTIQATIRQMQQDARQIVVMRLMTVDPEQAVVAINKLFTGPDGTTKSSLKVVDEPGTRTLMIYGSQGEIEQIRGMLAQMGEDVGDRTASREGNLRVLPFLTGRNARNVLSQVEQIWPTIHKSKIRFITPSTQPTGDEGALQGGLAPYSGIVERRSPAMSPVGAPRDESVESPNETFPAKDKSGRERSARESGVAPTATPTTKKAQPNREAALPDTSDGELVDLLRTVSDSVPLSFVSELVDNQADPPAVKNDQAESSPTETAKPKPNDSLPANRRIIPFPGQPAEPSNSGETNEKSQQTPSGEKNGATEVRVGEGAPIYVAPGPGGIMIASDDAKALDDLETLMRTLAARSSANGHDYTVFYLKHAKAQTIEPLIRSILSTGSTTGAGGLAGLGAGFGGRGNFGLGANTLSQTVTTRSSTPLSITSDARLNALFVQGSAGDLDSIEQLLQVLDQPDSPEDVAVVPRPRMIAVHNKSAEQVASVVRDVYSNRIIGQGGQGGGRGGTGGGGQDPRAAFFAAIAGGGGGGGRGGFGGGQGGNFGGRGGRANDDTPQMTIGVDTSSNSIIVSAPELLFVEVKKLVEELDNAASDANNDTMRVVTLKFSNGTAVQQALTQLVGDQVRTTAIRDSNNSSRGGNRGSGGPGQNSPAAQAFRAFGGGGGGGNFGGGDFGGGNFGGGNFGGGFQGGGGGGFGNFQGGGGGGRGGFGGGGGGGRGGGGGGRGGFGGGGGGRGGRGG